MQREYTIGTPEPEAVPKEQQTASVNASAFAEVAMGEGTESAERVEAAEHLIDTKLEQFLLHADKVAEGSHGIIFRLRPEDLEDEFLQALTARGIPERGDVATKLLKVCSEGEGETEYRIQEHAYELIKNAPNREHLAWIPAPRLFRRLHISDETRQKINQEGGMLLGDTVEMLLMEYLPGEDLDRTLMARARQEHDAMAKAHSRESDATGAVQDPAQLWDVGFALGFEDAGTTGHDAGSLERERARVLEQNMNKLYNFLNTRGVRVAGQLIEQIEGTMKLLNANGIRHRDGHERNIKVDGPFDAADPASAASRAYVFDFGSATEGESADGQEAGDDLKVVRRLRVLNTSVEDEIAKVASEKQAGARASMDAIADTPALAEHYEKFKARVETQAAALENGLVGAYAGEQALKVFIAEALKLIQDGVTTKHVVHELLTAAIAKGYDAKKKKFLLAPWIMNSLKEYEVLFRE